MGFFFVFGFFVALGLFPVNVKKKKKSQLSEAIHTVCEDALLGAAATFILCSNRGTHQRRV